MNAQDKTREQLIEENAALRGRIAGLEAELARSRQAEADQRQINNSLPVLIATAGLDGYYKEVNPAFERILGWSEQESLSRPFLEFIHPDDRTAAIQTFARLKSGAPAVNFLDRNICKDGSHRWISWIVIPVAGRDIVFGIGQDVTEQKQAEEAVRQSEQRMRLHVQQTPLAVIEWDLELRVSKWNPAAERIFGYTEEEVLGRHFAFLVPPSAVPHVDRVWDGLRGKRGGERSTNENVTKDGRIILCEWYNTPLVDAAGQVVGFASLAEDITDRKRTEASLRETERRLATVISNLPGAVYRCKADDNWTIEFLSDGYRSLTGYDPSPLIGQSGIRHSELIHPDDRQTEFDAMQQAVARKEHYQVEYRLRTAAGEEKWVWEQGTGMFSESGELEAIEGFTTDITDRKRGEEELQELNEQLEQRVQERTEELLRSQERFELAVRGAGVGIWDWDIRAGKLFFTPRWRMLFGYDEDEIGDRYEDWVQLLHPDERERITKFLEDFLAGTSSIVAADYRLRHKDGAYRWIAAHAVVVRDEAGKAIRLVGSHGDITDRKEAEDALRQSEAKYRALVESSPDVVATCDLEGRITFASTQAARLHTVSHSEELLGIQVTDLLVKKDRARFRKNVRRLIKEKLRRNDEYTAIRKDGTTFSVEISSAVIPDAAGNPEALIGVYRDITERKQAEERLKREQHALRRMVLAGDHERRLITYELHDGAAQQILGAKMLFESQQPPQGRKSKAADAYRDGMAALIRASSEIRRVMNRLRTPVLDKFGLVEAIDDVASQLRLRPDAPEIEYRHDVKFKRLEPTLENTLFRIAQEAMTNACRHSKSKKMQVTLTQKGNDVTLEVRDWGIGFDQDTVHENRFGLEGIRERCRIMGGKLSIKSKPDQGTVVRAKFPVIEAGGEKTG